MGYTIWPDGITGEVVEEVYKERHRQEKLRAEGKFAWTCDDITQSNPRKLAILAEEFGEAAREVNEEIVAEDKGYTRESPMSATKEESLHCICCSKLIIWELPLRTSGKRRGLVRKNSIGLRNKLAIRCNDCLGVYCRSCARKHFVSLQITQRRLDRLIASLAVKALKQIGPLCVIKVSK